VFFSKACQYAILAMTYLAEQTAGQLVPIREIGVTANVPTPFLGKIISTLSRSGLILARRGPNGGVMLNRAPAEVTVEDIVVAIDGPFSNRRCVLGLPQCNGDNPCPLHEGWVKIQEQLQRQLNHLTLADLSKNRAHNPPQ
jgi:Rrf2 family iron-sulfur cluster assembly transcriptional regulator